MNKPLSAMLCTLALCNSGLVLAQESRLDTDLALEVRYFPQDELFARQGPLQVSVSVQPEWYVEWKKGDHSLTVTPFVRYDSMDAERSHADLRELAWQGVFGALEVRAGLSRVFWGKTELLHLVDIINQDDAVENLDGEDKLGQPMLRLNWSMSAGSVQAYLLPLFRERPFSGLDARLRPPLPVADEHPLYESDREDKHVDYALRFQGYAGAFDYGVAWFSGTQRDPQLIATDFVNTQQGPVPTSLTPFYGLVDQLSLDAQYTVGSWLLKLEGVWRDQSVLATPPGAQPFIIADRYSAATGGFEYTQYGLFGSAVDAGWLVEYLWDEHGRDSPATFQNDLFIATRLAANDVNDSSLLAGIVVDLDQGSSFVSLEASRRLTGSSKISLELRAFTNIDRSDTAFYPIRQDDYLQLEYHYYL